MLDRSFDMIRRLILTAVIASAFGFACGWVCAVKCFGHTPASELAVAYQDLEANVAIQLRPFTRYISQHNLPREQWIENEQVINGVLNTVSRASRMAWVSQVPGTDGRLLRLNLAALGIPGDAWESMLPQEPYFHITTKALVRGKVKTLTVDAGHVGLVNARAMYARSGSQLGVVRLDWLAAKAMVAPAYYTLAGIPDTLDGYYKSLGMDEKTIVRLKANVGDNILKSGVTLKVRRVSSKPTPLGRLYSTYDTFGDDARKDFVRDPSHKTPFDAGEFIATRPNRMLGYFLSDGSGKRQDVVPDRIAKDHSDLNGSGQLLVGKSCISCHSGDGGLRPIAHDQSDLLKGGADILTPDPEEAEALAAFYLDTKKFNKTMVRDLEDYADALKEATRGMTPKSFAAGLMRLYDGYENEQIDQAKAKAEFGVDDLAPLRASHDGILVALERGKKVNRNQFTPSFPEGALILQGTKK